MKKIFLIDECLSSRQNGVGTYQEQMTKFFTMLACTVVVMSFNEQIKELRILEENGYTHVKIPICKGGYFLNIGQLVFPLLALYFEDNAENIFWVNHSPCIDFLKALRGNFSRSKVIFTIHDQGWTTPLLGDSHKLRALIQGERVQDVSFSVRKFVCSYFKEECRMYKIVDAVVCLSSCTKQLVKEVYKVPSSKLFYIPNAIVRTSTTKRQRHDARETLGVQPNEKILLYVGRQSDAKGIYELLDAFVRLSSEVPTAHLVIAGEVREFNMMVQRIQGCVKRVTFTGLLSKEELKHWYAAADIGVLPSYTEQCCYVGLEMLERIGVVVTTNGWGLCDMFVNGVNALIAPLCAGMPNVLVDNLYHVLLKAVSLNRSEVEKLCRGADNSLSQFYEPNVILEKYNLLLKSL